MGNRKLRTERLESRLMLHGDTNLDGDVTIADALTVINDIAAHGERPAEYSNMDVNNDRRISTLDALVVLNRLSGPQAERTITFRLGPVDAYTLTPDEVLWAINTALEDFERVNPEIDLDIDMQGTYQIASREIQIGGRAHARGQVTPSIGGKYIWFHNGTVSDNPNWPEPYQ